MNQRIRRKIARRVQQALHLDQVPDAAFLGLLQDAGSSLPGTRGSWAALRAGAKASAGYRHALRVPIDHDAPIEGAVDLGPIAGLTPDVFDALHARMHAPWCATCGRGQFALTSVAGRAFRYRGGDVVVREALELPVCDRCGEMRLSPTQVDALETVLERALYGEPRWGCTCGIPGPDHLDPTPLCLVHPEGAGDRPPAYVEDLHEANLAALGEIFDEEFVAKDAAPAACAMAAELSELEAMGCAEQRMGVPEREAAT